MSMASRGRGGYRCLGLLVCLGIALIARVSGAQERLDRLTLEDAVNTAIRHNATLRAKGAELATVRANEITASLRPNPTALYSAEQFGGGSAALPQHTVILAQPIETGGKRQRRIDSARAATRTTGHELNDVRRLVIAQVKSAFAGVLVGQATLALAEQNLKTLDEIERLQRVRAEKGDISQLELLRLQVQRFAFERDAGDARQAIEAATIALRAAVGPDALADSFDVVGELDYRDVPLERDELRRLALANRPDLQAARAARDKARADVNLARANAWWDVTPQIEYQRIGPDNTIGFGFSFPLKIFDRNQGEIARTRAEVDTALSAVTVQRDRIVMLRDTYLPKAQQARTTVEFAYRRGGASLLDFLDAQRTYRETALEHLRAMGNFWAALYQLEAAVGGSLGN